MAPYGDLPTRQKFPSKKAKSGSYGGFSTPANEKAAAKLKQDPNASAKTIENLREQAGAQSPAAVARNQAEQVQANAALAESNATTRQQAELAANPGLADAVAGIGKVPQQNPTTGGQLAADTPLEKVAALGAGLGTGVGAAGTVGGIAAGTGVLAGAAASLPITAVVAGGVLVGTAGTLIAEQRQKNKEYNKITQNAPGNFQAIEEYVNKGGDKQTAIKMWNDEKQKVLLNQANLKAETDSDLTKFLGAPGDELEEVNSFVNVQLPAIELSFRQAIAQPDPSKVYTYPLRNQENPNG